MASIQFKTGKAGKKTYYVVVSGRGKHKWLKAGSLKNAKSLKKQLESLQEAERLEKLGLSAKDMRIDDFLQSYSDYVRLQTSPATTKRYLSVLNTFIVFLRMFYPSLRYLSQIKVQIIESYQEKRLTSLELKIAADGEKTGAHRVKRLPKPQTVNYEIGVLRSAFLWAHERELIASVPTRKVRKLKPKDRREPIALTPSQCKLFLKTARDHVKENERYKVYALVFQFVLNSGLRSGEVCNLTWNDIDLESGIIKVQPKPGWTPKTYAREFYLNDVCLGILKKIRDRDGYVFKSIDRAQLTTDMLRNALIKIARLAGLEGFSRLHDLRHTFSTLPQINGVDIATAADILGHEDTETTRIYSHTYKDHLKKVVNQVKVR